MSYIGRGIDQIDNISTLDNLSFNGSDATFNLTQNSVAFVPVSADALQIQIDGVIQSGNYTVSGSTVTFDFTPSGSSVCNGIRHYGVGLLTTVSDGAVTTAKLGADSVTNTKVASSVITSQTAITSLADTDKFLVSDASDSGNLKYVEKQYLPSGNLVLLGTSASSSASAEVQFDNVFTSTYRLYKIIGFMTPENDDVNWQLRARTGGGSGSTYTGSDYHWGHFTLNSNLNGTHQNTDNTGVNEAYWRLGDQINSDNKHSVCNFDLTFYDPNTLTVTRPFYSGTVTFDAHNPSSLATGFVGGKLRDDLNITGLHFFYSSGDITSHSVSVYGVKQ
jgi:hypothetical protein